MLEPPSFLGSLPLGPACLVLASLLTIHFAFKGRYRLGPVLPIGAHASCAPVASRLGRPWPDMFPLAGTPAEQANINHAANAVGQEAARKTPSAALGQGGLSPLAGNWNGLCKLRTDVSDGALQRYRYQILQPDWVRAR
jgi:hypothetical protein